MSYTKVSIRNFQRYASRYLDKLPVILTLYGVPVATVIQFEGSVIQPTPENHESVIQAEPSVIPSENFETLTKEEVSYIDSETLENGILKPGNPIDFDYMKPISKWCGLNLTHPYSDPQDCYCVSAEDENGNPVKHGKIVLQNVWGCPKCIESLPYTILTGNPNGQ
jgi:hypothetical protein